MRSITKIAAVGLTFLTFGTIGSRADDAEPDARWGSLSGRFLYAGPPPRTRRMELCELWILLRLDSDVRSTL